MQFLRELNLLELSASMSPVESPSALSEYEPVAASGYNSSTESAYELASESQYCGPAEAKTLGEGKQVEQDPYHPFVFQWKARG
jgi:hypothetical protein